MAASKWSPDVVFGGAACGLPHPPAVGGGQQRASRPALFRTDARRSPAPADRAHAARTLLDDEIANVAVEKTRQHWPAESIAVALTDDAEQEVALHGADISAQVMLAERYGSSALRRGLPVAGC